MTSRNIATLGNAVIKIKGMADNLHNDYAALRDVDAAISGARAELADKVRGAIEGARIEHTRKQLEHIQNTVLEALRVLTDLGAYDSVSNSIIESKDSGT